MDDENTPLTRDDRDGADIQAVPEWFHRALAVAPSSHRVTVAGCDIHYLRWGPASAALPGILFIHGGGAHAQWWSFIAPFLADDRPVAAIDLSGMGDSGHRESYGSEFHVPEIAAVLADAGLGGKPILVGHSFGGYMTMCYCHGHGDDLSGAVIVDSPLRPGTADKEQPRRGYDRPKPFFPDRETISRRFRLMPAQPCENTYILDFIARNSVVERAEGWTWKFDGVARGAQHFELPLADYLRDMRCRKALIYGAESTMMTPEVVDFMTELFAPSDPIVAVPEAHHHLTVDQPLAFVDALRGILAGWRA
jgi:pimeloyl-ACP methyl ester carboxylesterase